MLGDYTGLVDGPNHTFVSISRWDRDQLFQSRAWHRGHAVGNLWCGLRRNSALQRRQRNTSGVMPWNTRVPMSTARHTGTTTTTSMSRPNGMPGESTYQP